MKRNIALLFVAIVTSFVAGRPAFAQEQNAQAVSQKLEKVSQGLVGRIGVAAQEIGSGISVTINGDEAFVMARPCGEAWLITMPRPIILIRRSPPMCFGST